MPNYNMDTSEKLYKKLTSICIFILSIHFYIAPTFLFYMINMRSNIKQYYIKSYG